MAQIRNAAFEQFAQDFLNDVAVYDTLNSQYLLKKTRNYYTVWCLGTCGFLATPKEAFMSRVSQWVDDSYDIGGRTVVIDRNRHYELIYEHCLANSYSTLHQP